MSAVALAVIVAVAAVLFGRRARVLYRLVRLGRPTSRFDEVGARVRNEATIVIGQRKLFRRIGPGLMHAFIFWGFIVLLPTIFMALIAIASEGTTIPWLGTQGWFAFLVDLFAVMVLAGVIAAFGIRKIQKPRRFEGSHRGEADLILLLIAGIVATLLLWHATLIALGDNEWPAAWSPVSDALSNLFGDDSTTEVLERVFVWAHVLIILTFLVYLPYSKHLHIATAAVNVYFGRTRRRGRLEPLRFDEGMPEAEMRFGAGTIADMTWKQMLDTMSCTECGRCQDVCPAFSTGKALSPKLLIMGLRDQLFAEGPDLLGAAGSGQTFEGSPLVPGAVTDDVVWDCVTCGACVQECPVSIEHVDHIVDLRRHLVMVEARFPAEAATMLRDVERNANPWGKPQTERADWTEGLGIRVLEPGDSPPDVLFWVGCAPAFDERAREGARSTARLMQLAGVDFAILGPRECCTGDPARRMGDEYTFQSYAQQNVSTLDETRATRIVTTCPHCFNTLSNEYPDFGGTYEVLHHTELLAALVRDGKLKPTPGTGEITYHDSCYLARHNDIQERAARVDRRRRHPGGDGQAPRPHVLLRRRRRPHVDGGARRRDQRGARPSGRRHRRPDARRRLSLLHRHAGRRRPLDRRQPRGQGRGDVATGLRGPGRTASVTVRLTGPCRRTGTRRSATCRSRSRRARGPRAS